MLSCCPAILPVCKNAILSLVLWQLINFQLVNLSVVDLSGRSSRPTSLKMILGHSVWHQSKRYRNFKGFKYIPPLVLLHVQVEPLALQHQGPRGKVSLPSQVELVAATVRPVHPLVLLVLVPSHHNLPTGPSALSRPPRSLRTATQLIPGSRTRAGDSCELSRGRRELATPITPPQPPNCNHLHCRDLVLCARNFYAMNQMKIKLRFIGTI